MTAASSRYAGILRDHRILYVPSCLIVEMMAKLFTQVSTISLSGDAYNIVPDLTTLLRRLTFNVKATAVAYREGRIRFFVGDWKRDKIRARKLLFNIMSRLGYISELLAPVEKRALFRAIEEMTAEWAALDSIMENRCPVNCGTGEGATCSCDYFRCESPENWRNDMARIILRLDAGEFSEYRQPGAYLLLLCYGRIKNVLVKMIGEVERKDGADRKFASDKILHVSDEEFPLSCPACTQISKELPDNNSTVIRKNYNPTQRPAPAAQTRRISLRKVSDTRTASLQQNRRYLMPPSLADIQGRR